MKRIALLGMPNTGKSTFFNRLTGASARIGNWPGITVDLMSAKVPLGGAMAEVVDLPGIYDLHGFSDDEQVVRHFLENTPVDLVLIILNTSQIERQLALALQIRQLGLPAVLLLNMADEARKFGITVNTDVMGEQLGMPVVQFSAKYGEHFPEATHIIAAALRDSRQAKLDQLRELLAPDHQIEASMEIVLKKSVIIPERLSENLSDRLDKVLLHPLWGVVTFFATMFLVFQAVFAVSAPLQDAVAWLLDGFKAHAVEPLLVGLPGPLHGFLIDGLYDGVGTVAAFVPVIVLFFLLMAVVEDTGYLSRAAFLMDSLMARLGLDGRSFVMVLMGFGCNVPALMGTRVMRSRPLRLLSMLVIPFSLCSARLQVFLFIIAALFSPRQAPLVLFSLYLFSFASAIVTALVFRKRFQSFEPFILELPPYRLPTLRQIVLRGWHEVRHFLTRASKFIISGVVLVWLLTHIPFSEPPASPHTWAGIIGGGLEPFLAPLGIDQKLAVALIFGLVAKEIVIGSLAVIFGLEGSALTQAIAHQMDWVQAYSFMLFTLIYTPCLSAIATLRAEAKSLRFALASVGWSMALAWVLSFAFYQGARALGY